MSWLGWGSSTNPQYEELVEKACSPLNLPYPQSENIADSLEITDMIRSKAVQPKPAMQSLKRRIASPNGRVQTYAIGLVDTCIKNGGDHFLAEIASKEFADEAARVLKGPITSPEVKQMLAKYFQQWAMAFKGRRELIYFVDIYNDLKNSGTEFPPPPTQTSSHLIDTITAPQWVDSDVCMRCRTAFTFTNRKHHCRNCGLVFDQACSSKSLPLPHFGITTPVRVCDSCFAKGNKLSAANGGGPAPAVPSGRTLRSKEDFDADLQRAIELSLAESRQNGSSSAIYGSEPPLARNKQTAEDDDEELRLAIEASLREMDKARPSAPNGFDEPEFRPLPTFDLAPREAETILTFSNTLDQMAAYGERDLRRFPHAHVLYEQAYAIGGKLHRNVEEKSTKQQMLAEMQDKLSQAVGLYGQILDGQQAYNARKLQEQQQRQYAQQQQLHQQYAQYGQYQPYQAYDQRYSYAAPPQANGYGYAPPQQGYHVSQHQPLQQSQPQAAGSSLYPSMPSLPSAQAYQPPHHGYAPRAAQGSQIFNSPYPGHAQPPTQTQPSQPYPSPLSHAPQSQPQQPALERHSSHRSVSSSHNPLQRHTSQTYQSLPIEHPTHQSATPMAHDYGQAAAPSAPPPAVDMSSHPTASASPRSTKSTIPPAAVRSASYTSPAPIVSQLPSSPKQLQTQSYLPTLYPPQQQPQRQQSQTQSQSQPQPQPHVYYDTSFPTAPAAVFPDAPVSEPEAQPNGLGLEKKEKEEPLLIEL